MNINFHQRMSISFVKKKKFLNQKKWEGVPKEEKGMFGYLHMFTQIKKPNENMIHFKSDFIPKNLQISENYINFQWTKVKAHYDDIFWGTFGFNIIVYTI